MSTLAEAQAQVAAWEAASLALATGQSYSIGGRQLNRVNAPEVRRMITYWRRQVLEFQAQANGARDGTHAIAVAVT